MKKSFRIPAYLLVVFLVLVYSACVTPGRTTLDEWPAHLADQEFSGVVLVARDGQVQRHWAFGFADCDATTANTTDTVFAIGSITKTFTELAVAILVEEGRLDLDGSISAYLTDVPVDKQAITVRHLVDHTSGLESYHDGRDGDFERIDRSRAMDRILSADLRSRPGSRYRYSNSGYTVLAVVIEEVTGQSYVDFLRSAVFDPAGMDATGFWGETFAPIAETETTVVGCGTPAQWEYSWTLVGNGGMVSTTEDLLRFVISLGDGTFVGPETMEEMGFEAMYTRGFGWAGGSSQHGFNGVMEYDAATKTLVVVIGNDSAVVGEQFARSLLHSAVRE